MKKLGTTSLNWQITLSDAPLDLLDVPNMSSVLGALSDQTIKRRRMKTKQWLRQKYLAAGQRYSRHLPL